jgi:hypothetical protein
VIISLSNDQKNLQKLPNDQKILQKLPNDQRNVQKTFLSLETFDQLVHS